MISLSHATSDTRILIVDDDLEIRQLLARYLSEQGFQITTAANGSRMNQALARLAHARGRSGLKESTRRWRPGPPPSSAWTSCCGMLPASISPARCVRNPR